jgi:hypothetical protein
MTGKEQSSAEEGHGALGSGTGGQGPVAGGGEPEAGSRRPPSRYRRTGDPAPGGPRASLPDLALCRRPSAQPRRRNTIMGCNHRRLPTARRDGVGGVSPTRNRGGEQNSNLQNSGGGISRKAPRYIPRNVTLIPNLVTLWAGSVTEPKPWVYRWLSGIIFLASRCPGGPGPGISSRSGCGPKRRPAGPIGRHRYPDA